VRILIVGTEEECEVAADRIARVLDARHVGRPSLREDGKFALAGTAISAYAAIQAREAARIAVKGIEQVQQQANEDRFSTVVSSIQGDRPAERVIGFRLLRRHVEIMFTNAESARERRDAYNQYISAIDLLESYLRSPPDAATDAAGEPADLGFGRPRIPIDNRHAANELRILMTLEPDVLELSRLLRSSQLRPPEVDLSEVQLAGQSWARIDFAWLGAGFFAGIDLRGANLTGSRWGSSFLQRAHLQCADLEGAKLQDAYLDEADLRGANLEGADLTGAELDWVNFDGVTGWQKVKGLPKDLRPQPGISRMADGTDKCLDHKPYWNISAASRGG
jgi:hypothetical protein